MDDFENVSKLVNQTGASYEEARYAYEACGKDMLAAAIMLEKAHGKGCAGADYHETWNKAKESFKQNTKTAAGYAGGFLSKLCRNNVKITGGREYFSIPVIAALLIVLIFSGFCIPAFIISIFCGIRYTITGPDISKDFTIGFERPHSQPSEPAQYTYVQPTENNDNGFFTKK